VPISALKGDNIVNRSENMGWYEHQTLIELLENIDIKDDYNTSNPRFAVQYVVRPMSDEYHDFRGYAGRVASGVFNVGDEVVVLPSGLPSKIKTIETLNKKLDKAFVRQSVTITLEDDIDISRGDMIVQKNDIPKSSQDIEMMVCWFNSKPMQNRGKYILRHTTNEIKCLISEVEFKMDINSLAQNTNEKEVKMNDIAKLKIRTSKPLYYDSYNANRHTGSVILIDEHTNETVAAGMII